jgi:hypothetical protein
MNLNPPSDVFVIWLIIDMLQELSSTLFLGNSIICYIECWLSCFYLIERGDDGTCRCNWGGSLDQPCTTLFVLCISLIFYPWNNHEGFKLEVKQLTIEKKLIVICKL